MRVFVSSANPHAHPLPTCTLCHLVLGWVIILEQRALVEVSINRKVRVVQWAEEAFRLHGAGLDGSGGSQGASGSVDDMQGQTAVAALPIPDQVTMSRGLQKVNIKGKMGYRPEQNERWSRRGDRRSQKHLSGTAAYMADFCSGTVHVL
jgi:hypothetical protein